MKDPRHVGVPAEEQLRRAYECQQRGQLLEAQALYDQLLMREPGHVGALRLAGVNALRVGNPSRAAELLGKVLKLEQGGDQDLTSYGVALCGLGQYGGAVDVFQRAIEQAPGNAVAHYNRGNALAKLARYEEAVRSFDAAIAVRPGYIGAFLNRGLAQAAIGKYELAIQSYDTAISFKPDAAGVFLERGRALAMLGRHEEAIPSFERASALEPALVEALIGRGNSMASLGQYAAAVASYEKALDLQPNAASIHMNRGNALHEMRQYDAAVRGFDKALALNPYSAAAHNNRGNALMALKRHQAALQCFDRAIELQPDYAEAFQNRGVLHASQWRLEEAIADFSRAIHLKAEFPQALINRAHAYRDLKQYEAAIADYDRVLALAGNLPFVRGDRLLAKLYSCTWENLASETAELARRVGNGEKAASAFSVIALVDSSSLQKEAATTWARSQYQVAAMLAAAPRAAAEGKIKIGYFSADFRDHPVGQLTAAVFEAHDRTRFEVSGFWFGPESGDGTRQRIEAGMQNFVDVRNRSDQEVAALARSMGIDIAIDLGGYTGGSRAGIFASRAAPIQVNFLGYPGTMGAEWMDYLIADRTIVPEELRSFYSERIAYIPSYQPNDSGRVISGREFSRAEMDLPDDGFVFCSFNNCAKITPAIFDVWARILGRVSGSVLWLSGANDVARRNLRHEAAARGIAPERIIFAKHLPSPAEHLARHRLADLFLDTLPYNAHTTASDALWAGLPLLTCIGQAFAGRVAASLLEALALPELIARSPEEYEELAVDLALDGERLMNIRRKLAANLSTKLLFDTRRYVQHLEAAYRAMHERLRNDREPEDIIIECDERRGGH